MRDIMPSVNAWREKGAQVALATVVETWGSSPRKVGAKMAISGDGDIAGSVSGGCVEGAVVEEALQALKEDRGRLLHFGVADETAWEVGLACGGTIEIFVEPLSPDHYDLAAEAVKGDRSVCTVTVIGGPEAAVGQKASLVLDGSESAIPPDESDLEETLLAAARDALALNRPIRTSIAYAADPDQQLDIFTDVTPAPPVLIMVGGVHIAVALGKLAHVLGYRTVVIDPRRSFGSQARFPEVDQLLTDWPDEVMQNMPLTPSTSVAVLTHDPKIDDRALKVALPSRVGYVGALGSRKTQAKRRERLLDAGLSEAELGRLKGPIGLSIGAQTPEEIALSIMAEIVASRHQPAEG
ncbi:MAG: XdhC family protein [Anaerolineales bacterium]